MLANDETRYAHVHAPGEGEQVWFLDNLLTIKSARTSGAEFSVLENAMPAGSHTPYHAHEREDEAFYVLEGTLTIYLEGGRVIDAGPGTYVHIPAGTAHGFETTSPVRMLVLCGGEGFFEMAREAGRPARFVGLPSGPPDTSRLGPACERFGIRILGPLPAQPR